jgi:hypothetical protein
LTDALATADLRRLQLNWVATSVGMWMFFIVLSVFAYNQGGASAVGLAVWPAWCRDERSPLQRAHGRHTGHRARRAEPAPVR